jgi:hypothetical protein
MSRLVKMTVCSARGTAEDDVAAIPSAARRKAMRPLLFHVVAVNGRLHSRLIKDLGRHQAATAGPDILRELTSTDDGDEFVGRPWSVLTRVTTRRNSVIWMRFSPITATTSSCSTCHRRKTAYADRRLPRPGPACFIWQRQGASFEIVSVTDRARRARCRRDH